MKLRNAVLDPSLLKQREQALLNEWSKMTDTFIPDGVVNPEAYCKAKCKILILLKEVNGGIDWDLRGFLRNYGGRKQTWGAVSRWIKGINDLDCDYSWNDISEVTDEERTALLQEIAAVNVKKTPGKSVANSKNIKAFVQANKDYLKKQVELYEPDLVICGGTDGDYVSFMESKPKWEMTKHGIWYFIESTGTVVVSYNHPEARVKEQILYYELIEALREILL